MPHKVRLDLLDDVNLTGISNGQGIKWDAASSRFIPATFTGVSSLPTDSAWNRVAVVSSSSTYQVYYNNVGQGAQAADYQAGTVHIFGTDSGHTRNLTGDIAELLIYNKELSATELNTVDAYLVSKWGL